MYVCICASLHEIYFCGTGKTAEVEPCADETGSHRALEILRLARLRISGPNGAVLKTLVNVIYGDLMGFNGTYPLENVCITVENHTF